MKRVVLDSESPAVRRFVNTLPVDAAGLELELDGRVICRVLPPDLPPSQQRETLIRKRWDMIRQAQQRMRGVSQAAVNREIQRALDEVRSQKRR